VNYVSTGNNKKILFVGTGYMTTSINRYCSLNPTCVFFYNILPVVVVVYKHALIKVIVVDKTIVFNKFVNENMEVKDVIL